MSEFGCVSHWISEGPQNGDSQPAWTSIVGLHHHGEITIETRGSALAPWS
jgi:hypothetical protein